MLFPSSGHFALDRHQTSSTQRLASRW